MKQRLVSLFEVEELEKQVLEGYQGEGLWRTIRMLSGMTGRGGYAELEKNPWPQLRMQKLISVVLGDSKMKMSEIQKWLSVPAVSNVELC